eukprot:45547-Prorocentrum_minimum.AAC.6
MLRGLNSSAKHKLCRATTVEILPSETFPKRRGIVPLDISRNQNLAQNISCLGAYQNTLLGQVLQISRCPFAKTCQKTKGHALQDNCVVWLSRRVAGSTIQGVFKTRIIATGGVIKGV